MSTIIPFKTIAKAAKLFKTESVLPILETACLSENTITWNDLETDVTIPFKHGCNSCFNTIRFITVLETFKNPAFKQIDNKGKLSIIVSEAKQQIKIGTDEVGDFPISRYETEEAIGKFGKIGTLTNKDVVTITDAVDFLSNDDLRPALTQMQLYAHVVATDAHRLHFGKLETPLTGAILMNKKVAKLLAIFECKTWSVELFDNGGFSLVKLSNENGVTISYRMVDAKFPDWKVVIPAITDKSPVAIINKKELRAAIKTGAKFGNNTTKKADIELNSKATYSTSDLDFDTEYTTEIPVVFKEQIQISFNWEFLDNILAKCENDKIKINYFSPTKAVIIEDKYLLMPLMNNY